MRILAFDTSAREFSMALLDDENLVFSGTASDFGALAPSNRGTSSLLIPAIKHGLESAKWKPSDLDLIGLTIGPGSFTGLRVGVVAAKSMAYVHQTAIVAVDTLEVIALKSLKKLDRKSSTPSVRVVLNAQRQQLYSAQFFLDEDGSIEKVGATEIVDHPNWINCLEPGEFVSGIGLKPVIQKLESERPDVTVASPDLWSVDAEMVGLAALNGFRDGKRDDLWTLLPEYYRPSAAEEKNPT